MNLNKIRSEDKRKLKRKIRQQKILKQRAIRQKMKIKRNKYYNAELENNIKQKEKKLK